MADDFRHGRSGPETRSAARTVVFALYNKVTLQDVAAPLEIFARANDFGANYRVLLASPTGQPVGTTAYAKLDVDVALAEVPREIDTLLVPGGVPADFTFTPGLHDIPEEPTPDCVPDAMKMVAELAPRARRVASVCTGSFVLAALGLLDGRRATTHWAHCQTLGRSYPQVEVDPDSLFVQDGRYITGAGITAGIDLALALVESDYGPNVARRVARWMVVFLQRPGGQAGLRRSPRHPGLGHRRPRRRPFDGRDGRSGGGQRASPGADVPRPGRDDTRPFRREGAARSRQGAARDQRSQPGRGGSPRRVRHVGHVAAHVPPQSGGLTRGIPEPLPHHRNRPVIRVREPAARSA